MEGKPYARQAAITALYALVGMHNLALKSVQTFIESEVDLDSYAYNVAIYAYGLAGEINKALNTYMKMLDKHLEPDIVTQINMDVGKICEQVLSLSNNLMQANNHVSHLPMSSSIVQGFNSLRLLNLDDNCIAECDEVMKLSQLKML
ncbi:hypothetical protein Ahy_A02g006776 [Arachis hypogaea]|uniref:Pentatricopeptide repeat-containing protein n=1 Tax=Arachis hypogaea TaxID=3818 RepID=A0A445EAT8_ARAHY|nr:hypothetical protein Ahy_A02g006776 [Arachis hypogaea]